MHTQTKQSPRHRRPGMTLCAITHPESLVGLVRQVFASALLISACSGCSDDSNPLQPDYSRNLNVLEFGAVGDGISDDTQAIQAALDSLAAIQPGGELFFPRGYYLVGSLKITSSYFTLRGDGVGATDLWAKPGSGPVIEVGEIGSVSKHILIEDLSINGINNSRDGIYFTNVSDSKISEFVVERCRTAIQLRNSLVNQFEQLHLRDNVTGVHTFSDPSEANPHLLRFRDCSFKYNSAWAVEHRTGSMLILEGCDIESNGDPTTHEGGGIAVNVFESPPEEGGVRAQTIIRDTWFESNVGIGLSVRGGRLLVDGCFFIDNQRTGLIDRVRGVTISNSYDPTGNILTFEDCEEIVVINSHFAGTQWPAGSTVIP